LVLKIVPFISLIFLSIQPDDKVYLSFEHRLQTTPGLPKSSYIKNNEFNAAIMSQKPVMCGRCQCQMKKRLWIGE